MGVPFYVLYAGERIPLDGGRLGALTAAFVVGQSVGNLLWGLVADRRGFRVIFLAALTLWVLSALLLMSATSYGSLLLVFAALGAGLGGFQMSAQNLVLEFGSRRNLPMRIAIANSAAELVGAIGAVLGGLLVAALSYVAVFWIAIAFQLAAIGVVVVFVDEPRRRS
jgi:MFS family permease